MEWNFPLKLPYSFTSQCFSQLLSGIGGVVVGWRWWWVPGEAKVGDKWQTVNMTITHTFPLETGVCIPSITCHLLNPTKTFFFFSCTHFIKVTLTFACRSELVERKKKV